MAAPEASHAGVRGFADGDRIEVRIDVAGAPVIEDARRVDYDDGYPNGRLCKPHCRGVLVTLASSMPPAPSAIDATASDAGGK